MVCAYTRTATYGVIVLDRDGNITAGFVLLLLLLLDLIPLLEMMQRRWVVIGKLRNASTILTPHTVGHTLSRTCTNTRKSDQK